MQLFIEGRIEAVVNAGSVLDIYPQLKKSGRIIELILSGDFLMRSYDAARGYFSFLGFLAWAIIVVGGLITLSALGNASMQPGNLALLAAAPGMALIGFGVFGLVYVQSGRATVDSAEYAQQALKVSRDHLDISKQLLKLAQASPAAATYTAPAEASDLHDINFDTDDAPATYAPPTESASEVSNAEEAVAYPPQVHRYGGHDIAVQSGQFRVLGQTFETMIDAKLAVDRAGDPDPIAITAKAEEAVLSSTDLAPVHSASGPSDGQREPVAVEHRIAPKRKPFRLKRL